MYVMTNGRNIEFDRNMNLINPIGYLADGRPVFSSTINANTRLYPQFNNITLQDVGSNSSYNALLVAYEHRWSEGFLVKANYTWGHAISDAPEVSAYDCDGEIEDPTNRNRDRSNSCIDRPDAFTLSSRLSSRSGMAIPSWSMPSSRTINLRPPWSFESGQPQSIVSNNILNGDTTTGSVTRPLFVPRNSFRGPSIYQVDLRYTRTLGTWFEYLQPQLFVESNNLFNKHSNLTHYTQRHNHGPSDQWSAFTRDGNDHGLSYLRATQAQSSKPASCSLERSSSSRSGRNPLLTGVHSNCNESRQIRRGRVPPEPRPLTIVRNKVISSVKKATKTGAKSETPAPSPRVVREAFPRPSIAGRCSKRFFAMLNGIFSSLSWPSNTRIPSCWPSRKSSPRRARRPACVPSSNWMSKKYGESPMIPR